MNDHHDVLRENILQVSTPKYTKTGLKLEYYEIKSNEWIPCKLQSISNRYKVSFPNREGNVDLPLNTLRLRPLYSLSQIATGL